VPSVEREEIHAGSLSFPGLPGNSKMMPFPGCIPFVLLVTRRALRSSEPTKEADMYTASDLRKGLKIEIEGDPCIVTDFQFSKPGKGQALYRCKIKNLNTGSSFDRTYRSVDKIDKPNLEERDMIYSYPENNRYIFMDPESYEQLEIGEDMLGIQKFFLIEDMEVKILFHNNRPLEITLPNFVEQTIAETEPGARGDTATNVMKPAKTNYGYALQVPLFINTGDVIRIDTRTGQYNDRVSKAG
jgi:elongation factor P